MSRTRSSGDKTTCNSTTLSVLPWRECTTRALPCRCSAKLSATLAQFPELNPRALRRSRAASSRGRWAWDELLPRDCFSTSPSVTTPTTPCSCGPASPGDFNETSTVSRDCRPPRPLGGSRHRAVVCTVLSRGKDVHTRRRRRVGLRHARYGGTPFVRRPPGSRDGNRSIKRKAARGDSGFEPGPWSGFQLQHREGLRDLRRRQQCGGVRSEVIEGAQSHDRCGRRGCRPV